MKASSLWQTIDCWVEGMIWRYVGGRSNRYTAFELAFLGDSLVLNLLWRCK